MRLDQNRPDLDFICVDLQAVKNKYSSKKLLEMSRIPQLKSNVVKNMAAAVLSSS